MKLKLKEIKLELGFLGGILYIIFPDLAREFGGIAYYDSEEYQEFTKKL